MKQSRVIYACIAILLTLIGFSCQKSDSQQEEGNPTLNSLTEEEVAAGWELLFDGSSFAGWKRFNQDTIGPLWSVQDDMIVCDGRGLGEDAGGSLTTLKQYGNFELTIDWKITPGGNSGILYHVIEQPEYKQDYETGPEYQVIDDAGWEGELKDAQKAGSNYDMFASPATKKLMPVGEWNTARIIYNNGHVEHWLNGEKTVEFEEGSTDFIERYKKSKWVEYPGWNTSKIGAISLQDHGAPVYYRNIKVRAL
ncbi:MAG: DUF1080 domain-containing protein [Bacteroidia bacterium]|nr:DUF1080 domain-containing protein [Bacteroidia bacterium]